MSRTYVELKLTFLGPRFREYDMEGGAYLDAISSVVDNGNRTTLNFADGNRAIINKPRAEVERMLAQANKEQPERLNWKDISGEPPKAQKAPGKSLAKRLRLSR